MANNKNFKPENILTADEWKLVSLFIELLKPFYKVTQQCSKNNALLSSVIPHAAALKSFLIIRRLVLQVKVFLQPYKPWQKK